MKLFNRFILKIHLWQKVFQFFIHYYNTQLARYPNKKNLLISLQISNNGIFNLDE